MKLYSFISAAFTPGWSLCPVAVESAFPQLKLEVVCENQIARGIGLRGRRHGRMFACEQQSDFDMRGLLGMAFYPGFANTQ